jgi:hypothetical protein
MIRKRFIDTYGDAIALLILGCIMCFVVAPVVLILAGEKIRIDWGLIEGMIILALVPAFLLMLGIWFETTLKRRGR